MTLHTLIEMINRQQPDCNMVVTEDTPLADLGLTSLDMIIIAFELERVHGLAISVDALKNVKTVGQLYTSITK
jgi:acyl carrier protein